MHVYVCFSVDVGTVDVHLCVCFACLTLMSALTVCLLWAWISLRKGQCSYAWLCVCDNCQCVSCDWLSLLLQPHRHCCTHSTGHSVWAQACIALTSGQSALHALDRWRQLWTEGREKERGGMERHRGGKKGTEGQIQWKRAGWCVREGDRERETFGLNSQARLQNTCLGVELRPSAHLPVSSVSQLLLSRFVFKSCLPPVVPPTVCWLKMSEKWLLSAPSNNQNGREEKAGNLGPNSRAQTGTHGNKSGSETIRTNQIPLGTIASCAHYQDGLSLWWAFINTECWAANEKWELYNS